MNTHPMKSSDSKPAPLTWLSRWAALLALLIACGVFTTAVAPTAWAAEDDDLEEVEGDDMEGDEDEEWGEEDWEEEIEEFEWYVVELEMYGQLLQLVLTYDEIASDPGTAGVAAVMAVEEHVEEASEAAALFEEVLPQVTNPRVERAIRLKLVDVYGDMDQPEKSLEQLKLLITNSGE
ncbi:hypothetical protein [Algisphaera agarilytica]|uniref:Uncharacterized protein n=1 Tax=Algisphaera agarilytica TaxID=1385975 RepID=A0A7X0H895_9BACT|nr:hypothetical protein [Algisphaera agarilytica]MBB6431112.1 hypothetical protein [Algisphaera agarilytica]